jgi:protein O-GlcNAc transferase
MAILVSIESFPGGSNPLFQADWTRFNCKDSSLVEGFRQKTIEHLMLQPDSTQQMERKVVLTVIQRNHTRRLDNHQAMVEQLSLINPSVYVQEVDLAAMDFKTQIQLIQDTDILVGVHGAGLTHILYLPPRAVVIEIMPLGLQYEGFRNLARLRRLQYFRIHGDTVPAGKDWHSADIHISKDSLEDVVEAAIDLIT